MFKVLKDGEVPDINSAVAIKRDGTKIEVTNANSNQIAGLEELTLLGKLKNFIFPRSGKSYKKE